MIRVLLSLALLAGLVPASAQGQSSRRSAQELFERGVQAMNTARFAEARDLFRRSLALYPNAGTAFNLAVALDRTGDFVDSVDLFGALLEDAYGGLRGPQEREVRRLRREAQRHVAVVHLERPPIEGLEIRVDGELRDVESLRVNPGEHVILATAPRYETFEETLTLERGEERTLAIELIESQAPGLLIIESQEDSLISVDGVGEELGSLRAEVPPGLYHVRVRRDGNERRSDAEVAPGSTLRMRLDLEGRRRRPWLWVGLSVLAVGAITAFAVGVTRDRVDDPVQDDVYGVIRTLRAP
ncbi:MAG: hypothetical protein AAGE52_29090 [Myxococcota bacterium]